MPVEEILREAEIVTCLDIISRFTELSLEARKLLMSNDHCVAAHHGREHFPAGPAARKKNKLQPCPHVVGFPARKADLRRYRNIVCFLENFRRELPLPQSLISSLRIRRQVRAVKPTVPLHDFSGKYGKLLKKTNGPIVTRRCLNHPQKILMPVYPVDF